MPSHKIILVKKPKIKIYYDCDVRYPVCVVESFAGRLPSAPIKRREVGDPFRADTAIPKKYRMYWHEYEDYMMYGGSPGHNAPAGFHKSDLTNYRRTFLLSNICPQEIVFNSGRWLLLETLCRDIVSAFPKTAILTGSVPGITRRFNASVINVPSHMYKVIVAFDARGDAFSACFMMPNEPGTDEVPLKRFRVGLEAVADALEGRAGFDIRRIVGSVGGTRARPLEAAHPLAVAVTPEVRAQMQGSRLYGRLVYSASLEELDASYAGIASPSAYHRLYYERAKERIARGEPPLHPSSSR